MDLLIDVRVARRDSPATLDRTVRLRADPTGGVTEMITALLGIGMGFAVLDLLSHAMTVPTFGPQIAAMIGIGVGIDYALFVVTRHRQGLADGHDPRAAVVHALSTAGRAVLFAGCTVVISLLGMLLLGLPFIYGLAFGAIAAVLLVMAATFTLLPAMLGFAGQAIDRLHVPRLLHRGGGPTGPSDGCGFAGIR